jgi:Ser/Thr protein kinase RdoA (MazF antagonist)
LLKNRAEPNYPALEAALIEGYRGCRPLDTGALALFIALRAASYLGWIVPRIAEAGAAARNRHFIDEARQLCGAYLHQHPAKTAETGGIHV